MNIFSKPKIAPDPSFPWPDPTNQEIRRLETALTAAQREIEELKRKYKSSEEIRTAEKKFLIAEVEKNTELINERDRMWKALEEIKSLPDQPAGLRKVGDYAAIAKAALAAAREEDER